MNSTTKLAPSGGVLAANSLFVIVEESRRPVTQFEPLHELHLIVASRDLATYHHLHPERDDRGTWTLT